ncbi:hypothetical protein ACGFT2_04315 [Streptomyces sp. NPDC048514]
MDARSRNQVFARMTFASDDRDDLAGLGVPTPAAPCSRDAIAESAGAAR